MKIRKFNLVIYGVYCLNQDLQDFRIFQDYAVPAGGVYRFDDEFGEGYDKIVQTLARIND